jgi:hypothetical protein
MSKIKLDMRQPDECVIGPAIYMPKGFYFRGDDVFVDEQELEKDKVWNKVLVKMPRHP